MDSDGPVSEDFAHGGRAYLNNASVSVQPHQSIRAMADFATEYCSMGPDSQASGPFVAQTLRSARDIVARIIGCQPDEVVLTQSVTDGINMVAGGMDFEPGSNIVIRGGAHEHHSNYYAWLRLSPGVEVRSAPIDSDGLIAEGALEELVDERTALVSLSHALYNTGAILPIGEIGAWLRKRGVPFFVDAAQTAGVLGRLDVKRLGCDFMSFNGSKWLCGPMGTGVFYCRRGSEDLLRPLAVGGESAMIYEGARIAYRPVPDRFQAGFRNYAGVAGMDSSIRYLDSYGLDRVRRRAISLANRLRGEIAQMPGASVYGPDEEDARTSIVPFTIDGHDPKKIAARLEERGLVLAVREILEKKIVRASPHVFNTESQVDAVIAELRRL